jgi:hypothetical protein
MTGARKRDEQVGPLREEGVDVEASPRARQPWKARRERVTTLKSMEPVGDASPASTTPVRIEQAPSLPPALVAAEPVENVAPPAVVRERGRLARSWPLFAAVAVGAGGLLYMIVTPKSEAPRLGATAPVQPSVAAPSASPPPSRLHLRAKMSPADAKATLDGKPLAARGTIDQELELACPHGHHTLRFEAPGHRPVDKRVPCVGVVVLEVALDALD